jgi:hypothetical protein
MIYVLVIIYLIIISLYIINMENYLIYWMRILVILILSENNDNNLILSIIGIGYLIGNDFNKELLLMNII